VRIAHVSDFYLPRQGGIELHVRDLAVRQRLAGHDVEIITTSPRSAAGRRQAEGIDGVRVHRLAEATFPASMYHPGGLVAGRRLVRGGGYDVVHAHVSLASPLAFAVAGAAAGAGRPLVVTAHSLVDRAEPLFRALDAVVGWSAWPAVWTAVSAVAAEPLRRLVGAGRLVEVLPNGIDPHFWQIQPVDRVPEDVVVAAVMRLARRKRALPLLKILRETRNRLDSAVGLRAVIVGEGAERRVLERYLDRHQMSAWVDLPGHWDRDRIRGLLARTDVFVAPATLETFGIAALEARCAGVPVLARSQGGISEFVTSGREGVLADTDEAMVAALTQLAAEPGQRAALAAHNRTTQPTLSWPDVLQRADEVYAMARRLVAPARAPVR